MNDKQFQKDVLDTLGTITEEMVTKQEIEELQDDMNRHFDELRGEVKEIRAALTTIRQELKNVKSFTKEIDEALSRIRVIEKHLGIEAK